MYNLLLISAVCVFGLVFVLLPAGCGSQESCGSSAISENGFSQQVARVEPGKSNVVDPPASVEKKGSPAAGIVGQTVDGRSISLSDVHGKVVLLAFWASWCGPCRAELPELAKLKQRYQSDEFTFITVNFCEKKERVQDFLKQNVLNIPVVLDPSGSIASKFGVSALPTAMLMDRNGYVRWSASGYSGLELEKLNSQIARLLAVRNAGEEDTTLKSDNDIIAAIFSDGWAG